MKIEDGTGKNGDAEVNSEQHLVVRAINESEIEHASGKLGSAFSWDSGERDINATDTMLFVKNTGDIPLILDRATINGSNAICTWTIGIGSATTTPTGTTVTGVNMNQKFASDLPNAIASYDEGAVATAATLDRVKTPIDNSIQHDLHGIILLKNHYVQFTQITESDSGSVILIGHFEEIS